MTSKDRWGEVTSKSSVGFFRLRSRHAVASLALDAVDLPIDEKSAHAPTLRVRHGVDIATSTRGESATGILSIPFVEILEETSVHLLVQTGDASIPA